MLKAAGCAEIFREHISGAKASRPELAKALARVRRSDVLVVARCRVDVIDEKRFLGRSMGSTIQPVMNAPKNNGKALVFGHRESCSRK